MESKKGGAAGMLLAVVFASCLLLPAAAQASASASAVGRKLANGLELLVAENHAVPLATICVAFRGGAIAQTPETAGLFHLYEHMLFTGNEKYPTAAAFNAAMNRMGVPTYNGATGTEYIYYYITVPSDKLADGIEFWSWAIKKPTFNKDVFENEKKVVLNEIQGYHGDPDEIMSNAVDSRFFSAYPWRKNIDGPDKNILGATLDQIRAMQKTYYIPSNAVVLVGGDVSPDEVYALTQKWFGDWQGGPAPVIADKPQGPAPVGLKLVFPDDNFYDGVAQAELRWRGPDSMRQTKDTYTSDVFLFLLSSPVGKFKQALMAKVPGLYDPEYIDFSYPTHRDGGAYYFTAFMLLEDPAKDGSTFDRAIALEKAVREEFALIAKDPEAYFGAEELAKAKAKLIDQNLLSTEVAADYVTGTLTFWWAVATTDYFFGYEKNCKLVSFADIKGLIGDYLLGAGDSIGLRMKSDAYASEPGAAQKLKTQGWTEIDADNAYWWQR
jgi:zinc protease